MAKKKRNDQEELMEGEKNLTKTQMEDAANTDVDEMLDEVPESTWDKYQHDAGHKGGD